MRPGAVRAKTGRPSSHGREPDVETVAAHRLGQQERPEEQEDDGVRVGRQHLPRRRHPGRDRQRGSDERRRRKRDRLRDPPRDGEGEDREQAARFRRMAPRVPQEHDEGERRAPDEPGRLQAALEPRLEVRGGHGGRLYRDNAAPSPRAGAGPCRGRPPRSRRVWSATRAKRPARSSPCPLAGGRGSSIGLIRPWGSGLRAAHLRPRHGGSPRRVRSPPVFARRSDGPRSSLAAPCVGSWPASLHGASGSPSTKW